MATQAALAMLDEEHELAAVVSPLRRRMLELLREPDSATGLGARVGVSRQKVNYHLRALEAAGLVELVEERKRRGCVERIMRATARSFLLSPTAAGPAPEQDLDRASSDALLAASARTLSDVQILRERAAAAGRRLATLTIEGEVALSSPAELTAFGEEVARAVARIADRYGREGGRRFRFVTGMHPTITKTPAEARRERRKR